MPRFNKALHVLIEGARRENRRWGPRMKLLGHEPSEGDLQCELHVIWFARPDAGRPRECADRRSNHGSFTSLRSTYGTIVRAVEEIEHFYAELSVDSFGDGCGLEYREVDVRISGIVKLPASGRSVLARRRIDKSRGTEPRDHTSHDLVGDTRVRIAHQVGAVRILAVAAGIGTCDDRVRLPTVK